MDRSQIDHTPLDIHVVDPCDRAHSIGRPFLTLAIDVCTRMIFGYYLTLEKPSFLSVALCLLCGVEMKDAQLRRFDLKGEWPVYGLPVSLRLDNGKEFWSKSLDDVALKYHMEVLHRRVRVPTDGPFIERVQGTLNKHLQNFAGTSKSSVAERGDYPAEERAFLTMEEVESILVRRIVEDYHQEVHETLGVSPIAAWREAIRKGDCPRALPNSPERFRIDVLPFEERTIQKDGVSLFDVRYSSATLSAVRRQEPRRGAKAPSVKYQVKYDPRDLSEVYLLTPANKVERLHTTRPAAGRFTKLMLEQSKAQARKNHRTWSDTDYLDMIRRERNAVDAAAEKTQQAKLTTKRERRNAARNVAALAATTNSTSPLPPPPAPPAPGSSPTSVSGTVPKPLPPATDDIVVTADDVSINWR